MANTKQKAIYNKNVVFSDEFYVLLKKKGKVKVFGLGIFMVAKRAKRKVMLPGTQTKVDVPAYKTVNFRPTKKLKEYIQ